MANTIKPSEALKPKYRYSLKAQIIEARYKSLTDFSKGIGTDLPKMSRIVSGWEIPSLTLQDRMAENLGITLRELKDLL